MEINFIQNVAMEVTEEQFNKDLKHSLVKMEYEIYSGAALGFKDCGVLVNNFKLNGRKFIHHMCSKPINDYYIIDEYNPDLYLALAAMTDSKSGVYGEYWMCKNDNLISYTGGKIYKQVDSFDGTLLLEDDKGMTHRYINLYTFFKNFRKATKEEIIKHFSKNGFPYTIFEDDVKKIISVACFTWKKKLSKEWGEELLMRGSVTVTEEFYNKMIEASNAEQKSLLKSIFKISDPTPFIKEFDPEFLYSTSLELFGDEKVLQIASGVIITNNLNNDLFGKSLYVRDDIEVLLHKVSNGTVIELKNKKR